MPADQIIFNFTGVDGGASMIRVGTYDPNDALSTDQNTLGIATIEWQTAASTPPFIMKDAQNIVITNLDLDHATVATERFVSFSIFFFCSFFIVLFGSTAETFVMENTNDSDYQYNIFMKFIVARGQWLTNVLVKEPTSGVFNYFGINNLEMEYVLFYGARTGGIVIEGNTVGETDPNTQEIQQHLGIYLQNSEIGETGDGSFLGKGVCLQL
jgi:hypothetical protein